MDAVDKVENTHEDTTDSSQKGRNQAQTDDADSNKIGTIQDTTDRTCAKMPVDESSDYYNMSHSRRGLAIIISYSVFEKEGLPPRSCAKHDADLCKNSFEKLGYEIRLYNNNPKKDELLNILKEVGQEDHNDSDSLIIVFMSHGKYEEKDNKEFIFARDGEIPTSKLWENFTAEKCPSLAGKPKMFFSQACRGVNTDSGVQLRKRKGGCVADSVAGRKEAYSIPVYADMLIMWATYPGLYAFRTKQYEEEKSVFVHFLTKVLNEDGDREDLASMLLRVTREVGIDYESRSLREDMNNKKQIPYIGSTLMRKIKFF
ncbi:caspase-1-like isoform X2 [Palaemon carinicauda]|uniref:caspase-1-like isoform X2 n=1 Tax=Palaemon carinicauda TaxID=392227 RepID=UPI0035B6675B